MNFNVWMDAQIEKKKSEKEEREHGNKMLLEWKMKWEGDGILMLAFCRVITISIPV